MVPPIPSHQENTMSVSLDSQPQAAMALLGFEFALLTIVWTEMKMNQPLLTNEIEAFNNAVIS